MFCWQALSAVLLCFRSGSSSPSLIRHTSRDDVCGVRKRSGWNSTRSSCGGATKVTK